VKILEERSGCVKYLDLDTNEETWLNKKIFEKKYKHLITENHLKMPTVPQEQAMTKEERNIPISKQKKHHSIVGFSKDREPSDFYPTPREGTIALLEREKFEGSIWECASGDGSMSKVIEEQYKDVYSSDVRTDEDVYGEKGIDFLKTNKKFNNIITNPPYRYAKEFVEHSLKYADKKVAMLLKLVFLEGKSRYQLFQNSPLKTVYVFCKRLPIYKKGIKTKNSGLICYAWFIWDKNYEGKPIIEWIL